MNTELTVDIARHSAATDALLAAVQRIGQGARSGSSLAAIAREAEAVQEFVVALNGLTTVTEIEEFVKMSNSI